jgi:hypothetical protein
MMREKQIAAALKLCAPKPHEREACRTHVEKALDVLDSADRVVDRYAKVTKKAINAEFDRVHRSRAAAAAHAARGVPLATRPPDNRIVIIARGKNGKIKLPDDAKLYRVPDVRMRAILMDWSRRWNPPSRWLKHKYAVGLAHDLLKEWKPDDIVVSRKGRWHRLAAVLFGDPKAVLSDDPKVNLYRHLLAFQKAWKGKIRRRQK